MWTSTTALLSTLYKDLASVNKDLGSDEQSSLFQNQKWNPTNRHIFIETVVCKKYKFE